MWFRASYEQSKKALVAPLGSCQRYARRLQGRNVGKKASVLTLFEITGINNNNNIMWSSHSVLILNKNILFKIKTL